MGNGFGIFGTYFELKGMNLSRYLMSHGMKKKDFQNKQLREIWNT